MLLDPSTRALFTLNSTGTVVWEHMNQGMDAIVRALVERFGVEPDVARADADEIIAELRDAGLVHEV